MRKITLILMALLFATTYNFAQDSNSAFPTLFIETSPLICLDNISSTGDGNSTFNRGTNDIEDLFYVLKPEFKLSISGKMINNFYLRTNLQTNYMSFKLNGSSQNTALNTKTTINWINDYTCNMQTMSLLPEYIFTLGEDRMGKHLLITNIGVGIARNKVMINEEEKYHILNEDNQTTSTNTIESNFKGIIYKLSYHANASYMCLMDRIGVSVSVGYMRMQNINSHFKIESKNYNLNQISLGIGINYAIN